MADMSGFLPGAIQGAVSRRISNAGTPSGNSFDPTSGSDTNGLLTANNLGNTPPNRPPGLLGETMNNPPPATYGGIPNGPLPGYQDYLPGGSQFGSTNAPAPAPKGDPNNPLSGGTGDPALDSYLGTDTTYQGQLSDLMRQYDQYNAQKNLTASQTAADYGAKQKSLTDQGGLDQTSMQDSAAARGILNSGIYANQLGQYNKVAQQNMTNLLGGQQNATDNASMAYNQFIANEMAAKQNSIQQAAARRAAQLGVF